MATPAAGSVKRAPIGPATVIMLTVAMIAPPMFVVVPAGVWGLMSTGEEAALQCVYCSLVVLVGYVVVRVEGLPLRSIGIRRPDASTFLWAGILCGVSLYVLPLVTGPLVTFLGRGGLDDGLRALDRYPLWFRVFLGATGGVVEETLYRGYAVERLAAITGHQWLAGGIAALAFALSHVPAWGIGFALGADLPFGILLTWFYLWRRDLAANSLAHSTGLIVAMLTSVP